MKQPISRDELLRRMLQCGGISPDDAENEAVMDLFDEIDRLRSGEQKPQGKTVRVRIPVVVDEFKNWSAAGWNGAKDDEMKDGLFDAMEGVAVVHWMVGDLPIPEETTVEGEVENANND